MFSLTDDSECCGKRQLVLKSFSHKTIKCYQSLLILKILRYYETVVGWGGGTAQRFRASHPIVKGSNPSSTA